jgi:hypothetical protein
MKTKLFMIILLAVGALVIGAGVYVLVGSTTSVTTLSEKEAVDVVVALYPQLSQYQNVNSPLATIETNQTLAGWSLGFIIRGSGLPGILDAKCYSVGNNKIVTSLGEYKKEDSVIVQAINL